MKCRLTEKKNMKIMLGVGLVLALIGGIAAYLLPEEQHLGTRLAGMLSGMGSALMLMSGAVLLRRRRLGEERARDSELTMQDERGLAVAYKAQNVAAIAAIFGIILMMIVALVRGDMFYAMLGSAVCCAVAVIKLVAWYIYNKRM